MSKHDAILGEPIPPRNPGVGDPLLETEHLMVLRGKEPGELVFHLDWDLQYAYDGMIKRPLEDFNGVDHVTATKHTVTVRRGLMFDEGEIMAEAVRVIGKARAHWHPSLNNYDNGELPF